MFGKWFKGRGGKTAPRQLDRPEQLRAGDMLEMVDSFGLPKELRGQTFEVVKVNTYVFGGRRSSEFLLQGEFSLPIHMTFENDDGQQSLLFTQKIERETVESILDMDAFSGVFGESLTRDKIVAQDTQNRFDQWLASEYYQNADWEQGEFFEQDLRHQRSLPSGEHCESLSLESRDGQHFISIEVWAGGETDVSLGIARPLSDLKSFYGKQ